MYLYLGQQTLVKFDDIIGIFDLDNVTVGKITKDYLKKAQDQNEVQTVSYELPKSFVLCAPEKTKKQTVFISQISSSTLLKRASYVKSISNVKKCDNID